MKSILDRSFGYTSSNDTDLRKTFARLRRQQRESHTAHQIPAPASCGNIVALNRRLAKS